MTHRYCPSPAEQPYVVEVLARLVGEEDQPPVLLAGIRFDHACEAGISAGPYRYVDERDAERSALELLERLEHVGPGMYVGKIHDRRPGGDVRYFDLSGPLDENGESIRREVVGQVAFCFSCNSQNRRIVDGRCLACGADRETAGAR